MKDDGNYPVYLKVIVNGVNVVVVPIRLNDGYCF